MHRCAHAEAADARGRPAIGRVPEFGRGNEVAELIRIHFDAVEASLLAFALAWFHFIGVHALVRGGAGSLLRGGGRLGAFVHTKIIPRSCPSAKPSGG